MNQDYDLLISGCSVARSKELTFEWIQANLERLPEHVSKANFLIDLDTYEWSPKEKGSFQKLLATKLPIYRGSKPSEKLLRFIEGNLGDCMHPDMMLETILRDQVAKKMKR